MGKARKIKKNTGKSKNTQAVSLSSGNNEKQDGKPSCFTIRNNLQRGSIKKKRDKRKERKTTLLEKLKQSNELKKEINSAKRRAKTAIIGDIRPLTDALPDLNCTSEQSSSQSKGCFLVNNKKNASNRTKKSQKAMRKMELEDMQTFNKVLELPAYKADPIGAIHSHIEFVVGGDQI